LRPAAASPKKGGQAAEVSGRAVILDYLDSLDSLARDPNDGRDGRCHAASNNQSTFFSFLTRAKNPTYAALATSWPPFYYISKKPE
jgi:hypothetical protein